MEERYSVQLQELQVAHEKQLRAVQQAAHEVQADMQASQAHESTIMQEAHAADMMRLQELQEALPRQLAQAQSEARHPQDLSPSEIGTCADCEHISLHKQHCLAWQKLVHLKQDPSGCMCSYNGLPHSSPSDVCSACSSFCTCLHAFVQWILVYLCCCCMMHTMAYCIGQGRCVT